MEASKLMWERVIPRNRPRRRPRPRVVGTLESMRTDDYPRVDYCGGSERKVQTQFRGRGRRRVRGREG